MKLIWHIVKKDLRRMWLPVALWAFLVAAQIGVGFSLLFGQGSADGLWFERMMTYDYVLVGLDLVFAYVLVSALVHDDSLVGVNVFWRTRPISGSRLLGAKLLGAAVMFCVLPVAIWVPWWLTCHYGWREMAAAVPEILGTHAVAIMAALLVAVLTDSLGRFLGWSIILAVTIATLIVALASSARAVMMTETMARLQGVGGSGVADELTESRAVMAFLVLMGVIAIAVIQQFMARRPAWVFAQVLAGFGLVTLVCTHYPWNFSFLWLPDDELPKLERAPALTNGIKLAFDHAILAQDRDDGAKKPLRSSVAVGLLASGIPDGLVLAAYGRYSEQTWQWPDGAIVHGGNRGVTGSVGGGFEAILGLPPIKTDLNWVKWEISQQRYTGSSPLYWEFLISRGGSAGLIAQASLPRAEATRLRAEPPLYTLNSQFGLLRYEATAELLLQPSDRRWVDGTSMRVVQSQKVLENRADLRTTMRLSLLESRPTSWTEGLNLLSPFKALRQRNEPSFANSGPIRYYLVNRDRGNIASVWTVQGPSVRIGSVEIARRILQFNAPRDWRVEEPHWVPQSGWFEKATLVKVMVREVARFNLGLKVDRFEVQP